ncbi:GNAT family N-acetyltransferase [Kitasatospora sp. NBC_01287]|uniref:GNAT family N-acetyltransferase n=1 Tax=Kitasatospora sp. NBC_01287 TaxID=2903573 RepID=UPI0022512089|nr:GNAT family N-acetyltransferase [Kitasatospora sp. NBC_01287]MCX4749907.1 GNAT family N-acetyltransferase [Kitasatospora sp. NBC_01287]
MSVTIEGPDGLLLRPWVEQDAEALLAVADDPELRARLANPPPRDHAEAQGWLLAQLAGWQAGDRFGFAVLLADRLAGHIALKHPDPTSQAAEVGYWTAAAARGQGVAPRALELLTGWAFEGRGLRRLELFHAVDNSASCRVAVKAGFGLADELPPSPKWPRPGHRHVRER